MMRSRPGVVAGVSLAIGVLAVLRLLVVADWDPTVFTAFGEEAFPTTEYAEEELGREVITRAAQGHDGKFFFVQANDPWLLEPERHAAVLDRPAYRAQRMLFPLLAGGVGLFTPEAVLWAMPIVNVLMLALGSWMVAAIARKHGLSVWLGLGFALNIGLVSELFIDGAGITAFALAATGAWALEEERPLVASLAFVGAVLTREVMLLFIGSLAFFWLIRKRRAPWATTLPAIALAGVWALYVRQRVDIAADVDQVQEITAVPFTGVIEALTSGRAELIDYLVIGVSLVLVFLVPYRAWRSNIYLTWGAAGFALLGPFLTTQVWQKSFDISRALAPLVTVFLLELFIARRNRTNSTIDVRAGFAETS